MDKIWLKNYQEGVPHEIDRGEYERIRSLAQMIDESCLRFSDRVAYENLGSTLTYAEFDRKSLAFAKYLQQIGLKKGDRVAIMMPNVLQYPVALYGILRAGGVVVNTNPLYTSDELTHQINDSGTEIIVVLANFAKTVEKSLPHTGLKHVIVTEIGDLFSPIKRIIVNAVIRHVKKMVPSWYIPDAVSFNDALKRGAQGSLREVSLSHEDIAFLQYTGGTTGVAKGAMLTNGNMVANVLQAYGWISPLNLGETDIIVTALPLYHIFSLTANCLTFLREGAKNILITNPRDIPHFIKEIKNCGFTAITGVNTLFNAMMNNPHFSEIDFSKVKLALSGGMSLQKSVSLRWHDMTKSRVLEAYGLTETSPAVTINPMYLEEYNGSIGLPISSTDISIRDDDGNELPIGELGELCVKGPQVTPGYWNRPDETAKIFTKDGYLRTGDIARVDEDGFVYLVDRKKDMIIVSGFNVYPNEVEQVIGMLAGVMEVGVVGVTSDESGERVKAFIVKRDPSLTEEDVIAYCREHLTAYKIPKIVEFVSELPKTNVGKILRRALRDMGKE
ncbi:AMP-binding protein [Legionella geestiana]|uniref:AMP-binding protein n=1 Tax=Legionella geestiana TaxID=45065 RepID=UPI001091CE41|nr:AMP-binding protein [Legionella geestiana]QDQ40756.1 AMP-binding protein [Legionella geestiana]